MKKNNMLEEIIQVLITGKGMEDALKKDENKIKPRKLSYEDLIKYLILISLEKQKSYRESVFLHVKYNLPQIHYSELSKRASELSYEVIKTLFEYVVSLCNRRTKRKMNKIKNVKKRIEAVDSTTITTSKAQLRWAGFKGQRAGIKLHVKYDTTEHIPSKVVESAAKNHDSRYGDKLKEEGSILVEDRAYGKIDRFDDYVSNTEKQSFVIRIKENLTLVKPKSLRGVRTEDSNILRDLTCQLGSKQKRSNNRFRVVIFEDAHRNEIRVCTDLMDITAETIAEIYKSRWEIESFFRFMKQNLNLSTIFGTTRNAVFNQLYAAMIAYVIVNFLYKQNEDICHSHKITMIIFIRSLIQNDLIMELKISFFKLLKEFHWNASKSTC